jgi:hypothetical protein
MLADTLLYQQASEVKRMLAGRFLDMLGFADRLPVGLNAGQIVAGSWSGLLYEIVSDV